MPKQRRKRPSSSPPTQPGQLVENSFSQSPHHRGSHLGLLARLGPPQETAVHNLFFAHIVGMSSVYSAANGQRAAVQKKEVQGRAVKYWGYNLSEQPEAKPLAVLCLPENATGPRQYAADICAGVVLSLGGFLLDELAL